METKGQGTLEQTQTQRTHWRRGKRDIPTLDLSRFSILPPDDPDRGVVTALLEGREAFSSPQEDRALGCFLGMMIGDAMGAPLEFTPVR